MMIFIFVRLQSTLSRTMRSQDGQDLAEYALILALIAVVAIVSLKFLGSGVNKELTSAATSL